jgi:sugar phosphate isomerase/epimerase
MSYLSVSTWSLHRLLGPLRFTEWDDKSGRHVTTMEAQPEVMSLLELPFEAAKRGYDAVEICHFHFPSQDAEYLTLLRQAFRDAGIAFDTLLLDYGDLSTADPTRWEADVTLIRGWIDAASHAGAKQIRVIAGDTEPADEEAIRQSASRMIELSEYASRVGVRVVSENFHRLTETGKSCARLLELTGDSIAFITDFGNFKAPSKYAEFGVILPHSVSVHAKAHYDENGFPDELEFRRCLDTMKPAAFNGAIVLIYDGPGDMWEGLDRIRRIVSDYQ